MATESRSLLVALAAVAVLSCGPNVAPPPGPMRASGFRIVGEATPSDTGPPTLHQADRVVTIQGVERERTDGGLYGDVDSTQQGTLRLTLFDSIPGKAVHEVSPAPGWRQVLYEARLGPLRRGSYDVWVGRWDPESKTVVVTIQPLHIEVP